MLNFVLKLYVFTYKSLVTVVRRCNLQRCCNGIITSFIKLFYMDTWISFCLELFVAMTYFTRSPLKVTLFPNFYPFTGTWRCEYTCNVQQAYKYKQNMCDLVTSRGHFEVNGKVQIRMWPLYWKLLLRATHWCSLYGLQWYLLMTMRKIDSFLDICVTLLDNTFQILFIIILKWNVCILQVLV